MKEFNTSKLLEARLHYFNYYNGLTQREIDAIEDFLIDVMDIDLNTFNIDDFIINGLSFIDKEELEEYRNDYTVIFEDDKSAIVCQ